MRKLVFLVLSLLLAMTSPSKATAAAAHAETSTEKNAPGPAAELSVADAITLGVVEGVTEYLPISSTGHLIIVSKLLGLESEKPLVGRDGQPLWYKKPSAKHPDGEPLTLKLAADTYAVVIQFGAIAAVAILYWSQLKAMARGLIGRDVAGRRLAINLLIAFVPAVLVYLVAHSFINSLFSVGKVIVAQVAGAGLMLFAENWRRRRAVLVKHVPESSELTYRQAAQIGLLQCVAMWPGTSRSMMTIVGGYFAGLDGRRAAEFSFLLGFLTLSAASLLKSYSSGAAMIQVFGWSNVLLGAAVAAVTAGISVRFLVTWLTRHGLAIFAVYRLVLAAVIGALLYH